MEGLECSQAVTLAMMKAEDSAVYIQISESARGPNNYYSSQEILPRTILNEL